MTMNGLHKCVQCGKTVKVSVVAGAECCARGPSVRVLCADCRDPAKNFPQYHLRVGGADQWLTLHQAGAAYDNGWSSAELGEWVVEKPGAAPRRMTDRDHATIRDAADRYSESK